jgi:hypothetical protein
MTPGRTRRQQADWIDGHDRLHIAEQYAGQPGYGLVLRVEQRTTLAGHAVLLTPAQVAEVHAWLSEWLTRVGKDSTR